ncbi:fibrillin-1 [Octopus bimaculoides]|uniref:fibrillin-1 n=1 Tax=Octopus bimaculoides TaxID=37653 RepID=UPI00071D1F31|nr:fibrillin-1 [Octopus bimaculoides]|eukprot:XP_014779258.1 PREDICTED: fibrillin-1-like [Octopus bimaculoides]
MPGSYHCECPPGYSEHYYWKSCVDVDECMMGTPCGDGGCINMPGSYNCNCKIGENFDPRQGTCMNGFNVCNSAPCTFGCSPYGINDYVCGCPTGYQRIGQGHCISTISPANISAPNIPEGMELPHIPGPPDGSLPPGEVCYSCNVGDIPLGQRSKRSVDMNRSTSDFVATEQHQTSNVSDEETKPKPKPKLHHYAGAKEQSLSVKVKQKQVHRNTMIIRMQPALSTLRNKVHYIIVDGGDSDKFVMHEKNNISSLRLKEKVKGPQVFKIDIKCQPLSSTDEFNGEKIELDTSIIHLKIYVL